LFDAAGDDTFFNSPLPGASSSSVLTGAGGAYRNEADGFRHVRAAAGAGGQDSASLVGSSSATIFRGAPANSSLTPSGSGYDLSLLSFFTVSATAGSSSDAAYLQDSPGNDSFTARPDGTATLDYQSAGHLNLSQYPTMAVYGSAGKDNAYLYGHFNTS